MFQIKTSSLPSVEGAKRNIEILSTQLSRKTYVTWLLAGGSAIEMYKEMNDLVKLDLDFTKLSISLGDERYSKNPKHKDATWPVFDKLKLFKELKHRGATIFNILSGKTLEKDSDRFNDFLHERLRSSDFLLSNLGIGTDCHTAGIIPMEDKTLFEDVYPEHRLAVGHKYGGMHPNRITITPGLLKKVNIITVYVTGIEKKLALEKLNTFKELEKIQSSIHKYPALIPSFMSAEVFTDQKIS